MARPAELARLDPAYAGLYDAIVAAALDAGVGAVIVGGSLARGDADRYSDLDLAFVVEETAVVDAAAIIREATPTVLLRTLPFGIVAITPEWLRLDVVVTTSDATPTTRAPDIRGLVEEFLRVLGLLPVVIGRGEWIVASDGAWLLRSLLVQLLLLENGETVVTGVKRLNGKLTEDQQALVEGLPPIETTREGAIAAHRATAEIFLPRAQALLADWPTELEGAARSYLVRQLDLELDAN